MDSSILVLSIGLIRNIIFFITALFFTGSIFKTHTRISLIIIDDDLTTHLITKWIGTQTFHDCKVGSAGEVVVTLPGSSYMIITARI